MDAVKICKSPFGGLGLFSIRDFLPGQVVLMESPFLLVPTEWENMAAALSDSSSSSKKILAAVERLNPEQLHGFWAFTQAPCYGQAPKAQGVFWTNCISMGDAGAAMFMLSGRMHSVRRGEQVNHSCRPTVDWTYDNECRLTVKAVERIAAGDEVLAAYYAEHTPYGEVGNAEYMPRAEYLSKYYGFTCQCTACSGGLR